MALSEFKERQFLRWGDFLIELEEKIETMFNNSLDKDERKYIENEIKKGDELQEQLNEEWLDKGFMTYCQYMSQIYSYIHIQDEIMNNLEKYLINIKKYKENKK